MRASFLGLAATSLLLMACGDESSTSSTPAATLSDRQVLAALAQGANLTEEFKQISANVAAPQTPPVGRALDMCGDLLSNRIDTLTDDSTGEKMVMTLQMSLPGGAPLTCEAMQGANKSFQFAVSMVSPSMSMTMSFVGTSGVGSAFSASGSANGTFNEDGMSMGIALQFQETIDSAGTITAYNGTARVSIDGATTDPMSFGLAGIIPQTVKVYRGTSVIGTITFAADGSTQIRDASGALIEGDKLD